MRRAQLGSAIIALALSGACMDNPFGRPTTVVDGTQFPTEVRGNIAPKRAYLGGNQISIYLLGQVSPAVRTALVLSGQDGMDLPSCRTRQKDAEGHILDVDFARCQGAILEGPLPDTASYSPFVKLLRARVPAGYVANTVRSLDEAKQHGLALEDSGVIADFTVIDPEAVAADPSGKLPRLIGWYRGLELVFLDAGRGLPASGAEVTPMDLLVPENDVPGSGNDLLRARAGMPGYSTLCRISYYRVPDGMRPGDIKSADALAPDAITQTADLVHCVAP